jgi:UDP-GlcNAc:undecaprenyl-phosphate GlcNAc-1-phosphate transferase
MSRPDIFILGLVSFVVSFFLSYLFQNRSIKIGNKERSTFGGLVIFISIFVVLLLSPLRVEFSIWRLFLPFTLMFIIGFIDDYREFSPYLKLLSQALIIILAIYLGLVTKIIYIHPVLNYVITFLWLMIIVNAFNFLDILDGLCAGVIFVIAGGFSLIGFLNFQPVNLLFAIAVFFSVLGFLPFNYRSAKAYLGDSGSLSLGMLLGMLSISFSYAGEQNPWALFTPLVIMGLPLFDFGYVTGRRILQRKSIFRKSPDHLAILMQGNGVSISGVVTKFHFISLLFVLSAIALQFSPLLLWGIVSLAYAIFLFIYLGIKYY